MKKFDFLFWNPTIGKRYHSPFLNCYSKLNKNRKRFLKARKCNLCKYAKSNSCKIWRCSFAHSKEEQKSRNRYNNKKDFNEKSCFEGNKCKKFNCRFYHSIEDKRINICLKNLRCEIGCKLKLPWLKISETIPELSFFNEKETRDVIKEILDLKKKYQNKYGSILKGIEINLIRRRSEFEGKLNWEVIEVLKDVDNVFFKSKDITYIRSQKQLSLRINKGVFVNSVCGELKLRTPSNLKLVIQSVGNNWDKLCQLLDAIQQSKNSLYKLELDIRDLIGPVDLPILESKLRETLIPLKKLRVIKLRFQLNFIQENGAYEKDLVDIALEILEDMSKESANKLKVKLTMFGISVSRKDETFQVLSDPCRRNTNKRRRDLTQRLQFRILHFYLINNFSKKFLMINKAAPEFLKFDFQYIYGIVQTFQESKTLEEKIMQRLKVKKQPEVVPDSEKDYRKINAIKYEKEINSLLNVIKKIISFIPNNSIKKFQLKFFAFIFQFESDPKRKLSSFHLKSICLLSQQNKSIVTFNSLVELSILIRQKLCLKFKNQILSGSLGRYIEIIEQEQKNERDQKQQQVLQIQSANLRFLKNITGSFNSLYQIKTGHRDLGGIYYLLKAQQRPILCNINYTHFYRKRSSQKQIITINNAICLFRSRMLAVFKLFKKIQRKDPKFKFRKEIISEIFKNIKLEMKDLDQILDTQKQNLERSFSKWVNWYN